MNKLIDRKQAVTALFFIVVPQLIIEYMSYGMSMHNSGYWINFIVCSTIAFFMLLTIKKAFNKKLNAYIDNSLTERIIKYLFFLFILLLTFYNYIIGTNAIASVTSGVFTNDIIAFLTVLTALICSLLGIEAVGRLAYIMFYTAIGVLFFICFITLKGWQFENVFPVFGTTLESTFFDFKSVSIFLPLLCTYLIRDNINETSKTFDVVKKLFLYICIFGGFLLIICILTVPYPMINLFDFSLVAIFSVAKSTVFFHRFELLLVFLLMILNIMALSVGLHISSDVFSKILKSDDSRPFCLAFSLLFFYLSLLVINLNLVKTLYIALAVLLYVFFIVKSIVLSIKKNNTKRARH